MSSVQPEELPPLPDPDEVWTSTFDALDTARQRFFESCDAYATSPHPNTYQQLKSTGEGAAIAMRTALTLILVGGSDTTAEERISMTATLIFDEEKRRVDHLNQTTGSQVFKPAMTSQSSVTENLAELTVRLDEEGVPQKIADELSVSYVDCANTDLTSLINMFPMQAPAPPTRVERLRQLLSKEVLGKHVLDIAKISAGVLISRWILRDSTN